MDNLEEKHLDTSRGFHYRYYISSASQADSAKPTLLLCHGFPDDARLWQFIIPHLQQTKLRIVVPDLLGYGGTSKPTDPKDFEIKGMVQDVMDIMKKEGLDHDIIPVGHDWGAYLAQRFCYLNPSACVGLVTLNVALMAPNSDPFDVDAMNKFTESALGYPVYAYWELFLPAEGAKLLEDHLESTWYVMHADVEDWMMKMFCVRGAMKEFLEQDRKDVPLKEYAKNEKLKNTWIQAKKDSGMVSPTCWYRAMAYNHQRETEASLNPMMDKPYLFIGCDGDAVCRTDFIEIPKQKGLIKDCTVKELHSGHWCPYEKPKEVAEAIVDWLRQKGFSQ